MNDLKEKLHWFGFILPGFLAIGLARILSTLGNLDEFQMTVFSFALSVFIFGIVIIISLIYYRFIRRGIFYIQKIGQIGWILAAIIISVPFGFGVALAYEKDVLNELSLRIGAGKFLPKNSGHLTLDVLLRRSNGIGGGPVDDRADAFKYSGGTKKFRENAWVIAHLEGGTSVAGSARLWEGDADRLQIFISPACTQLDGGVPPVLVPGPGVWVNVTRVIYIEFVDPAPSPCSKIYRQAIKDRANSSQ